MSCSEKHIEIKSSEGYTQNDLLICATNGYIYAIDKKDGTILWSTYIAITASVISVFVTDNGRIIAGAAGYTYALDLLTGEIKWSNNMPGFGYKEVSIVTTGCSINQPPQNNHEKQIVIACSKGGAIAMDFETGKTLWNYNCPGGGYNIPVAIVEESLVYIGSGRCVYCLNAKNGHVVWSVSLSWNIFGAQYMTLANAWSSKLSAERNTAFSQNPVAQAADKDTSNRNHDDKNKRPK